MDARARQALKDVLVNLFGESDLKELAFEMGIDYEALHHATKMDAVVGLIEHMEHRRQFDLLYLKAKQKRREAGL